MHIRTYVFLRMMCTQRHIYGYTCRYVSAYTYLYIYRGLDWGGWKWCLQGLGRAHELWIATPNSTLQCIAVRCSVLWYDAVCCSEFRQGLSRAPELWIADPHGVWQCVQVHEICGSHLKCVAVCCSLIQFEAVWCRVLQGVAVHCFHIWVLQCVAVCCSVLQGVAVCCSVQHTARAQIITAPDCLRCSMWVWVCVLVRVCAYI